MSIYLQYDNTILLNSIHLSGSDVNSLSTTGSLIPQAYFGPADNFVVEQNGEYTVQFTAICTKDNSGFDAVMEVYLVGQAFTNVNPLGVLLTTLNCSEGSVYQSFENISTNIIALGNGTANIRFVVYGGQWQVSNVSIKSNICCSVIFLE